MLGFYESRYYDIDWTGPFSDLESCKLGGLRESA